MLDDQSFIIPDFTDLNENASFKKDNTQRPINKVSSSLTKNQYFEKRQDAPLRKINIDVETTSGFLENFKSDFDPDYLMAQHRALYVINNYNLMTSLISVRDLNLAIEISRIYLYENENPWVGLSRKRISLDVQTYWNGSGWVFSDSLSPEMDIDEELPEQLYDNEYPINFVEQDNRLGAGEKIDRFRDGHIAIVEILTHLSNDGVANQNIWSLIENPERSTGAYFVVGTKKYNHSNFYHYSELDLDEALSSLTIQNLSNLIMHELGHSFGFSHTHARGLDNCEYPDNPDIEIGECENFQQNLEEIGTLMSYCHLIDTRYDEESIESFQDELNNADPINRDIYLPVANNQNPVITLVQTSHLRDDRSFTLTVNARDPNRQRLIYKYELSSGRVIHSFSSILNEQFLEDAEDYWVRITVMDNHGGSISRVQNLLKLNPDNVELLVKNNQNELINPQAIPLGEEVRLVLKFRNIFNYLVNCQLTINEEILSTNSINRNGWSECVFPHQFVIPGAVSLSSQLTVDGYYPSFYQHKLTVVDSANSINQAPVIREVVFQRNVNSLILGNTPIEGLTTDQEYGFSILIFDREGDNVECIFDTEDGVQTIIQSAAIGNDPRERICLLFNYQFQRADN